MNPNSMSEETGTVWQEEEKAIMRVYYQGCCHEHQELDYTGVLRSLGNVSRRKAGKRQHFSRFPCPPLVEDFQAPLKMDWVDLCTFRGDPEAGKQQTGLRFMELSARTVVEIRGGLRECVMGTNKSPMTLSFLCLCAYAGDAVWWSG